MLIAGDIGGTKTDLAIFTPEAGPRAPLAQARFRSADYPTLEAIVEEFLDKTNIPVRHACFDVAGPVVAGKARLTNLPWVLDEEGLKQHLGLESVKLMNDLEAIAYAVPILGASDLHTIKSGQPVQGGAIAIIAPGTGLGEAFLTWDGMRYQPYPSEGGHANFAPTNELEIELLRYLLKQYDTVSYERVVSGIGIPNIYNFLKESNYAQEPPELLEAYARAEDKTRYICQTALDPNSTSPLCRTALDIFVSSLAVESGNLALKVLSTGGLYIGGGIPVHVLSALDSEQFVEAFVRKGRFSSLLSQMPVHVITTSAAMLGVASYGLVMSHL